MGLASECMMTVTEMSRRAARLRPGRTGAATAVRPKGESAIGCDVGLFRGVRRSGRGGPGPSRRPR